MTATTTACPDCGSDLLRRPKPNEPQDAMVCMPCRLSVFRAHRALARSGTPVAFFDGTTGNELEGDGALDAILDLLSD